MVLIGFGVIAVLQYAGIGHIFQIGADFPFHEPGKGIAPAKNAHQFTDDDINGVPLPGVCPLMNQYFVEFFFRMRGRMDKNPVEKGERSVCFGKQMYICVAYLYLAASACQVDDARQLHDEAYHQQCHYSPIGDIGIF